MRSRLTQFALILTTMLALLASTVSACACGHHEVKAAENAMPSCHHGAETAAADPDAEAIDAACICYVNLPAPFIIGQSEQSSVKLEKQASEVSPRVFLAVPERLVVTTKLKVANSDTPIYISRDLAFTPSRAPPRL